ncbi:MAG: hypothetical protein RMI91_13875 [Gemmatales bacterium]|nr:hypothetical protein [Gemmatales bacterium]
MTNQARQLGDQTAPNHDASVAGEFELRKHPLLERQVVRQIGIYGARGTGKTCYLAALYGNRTNEQLGFSISFDEDNPDDSLNHLDYAWKCLKRGSVPPATALVQPFRISFTATYQRQSWKVRTLDYAGALVQRQSTGTPELKKEVLQWLCDCDAVLILIDITESHDTLLERLNEIDLLINRLRALSPDGQTVPIPVGLIFTKWDHRCRNLRGASHVEQRQLLRFFLEQRPEFRQFCEQAQAGSDRVCFLPVSAFGHHLDKNMPPPEGAQPFGIHEPLLWALQECDQAILDAIEREVAPMLERPWAQYGQAIARYKTLARQRLLTRGPIAALLQQRIRHLRARAWRRSAIVLSAFAAVSFALISSAAYALDTYQYRRALDHLASPKLSREEKEAAVRDYLATKNPMARILGRVTEVKENLVNRRKAWHEDDYTNLLQNRMAYKDNDEKLTYLIASYRQFLQRWPDSPRRSEIEDWLQRAEARLHSIREEQTWQSIQSFAQKYTLDSHAQECVQKIEDFLKQFPQSRYESDARALLEQKHLPLKRWRTFQEYDKTAEGLARQVEQMGANGGDFAQARRQVVDLQERCRQFLEQCPPEIYQADYAQPMNSLMKRLDNLLVRIEQFWDDHEWRQVKAYAAQYPEAYDAILNRIKLYLESPNFGNPPQTRTHKKRHIQEANELQAKVSGTWDREEYVKFYRAAKAAEADRKVTAFESAARQANAYLTGSCPKKQYKDQVERWLTWLDGLRNRTEYTVVIVKAEIGKNASQIIDAPTDNPPDVNIHLRLSTQLAQNQSWQTQTIYDTFRPTYDYKCQRVRIRWNDPAASLTLTLTDIDTIFDNWVSATFNGPDVLFLLDSWISVRDGDATHYVLLSCEDLRPPSLPER